MWHKFVLPGDTALDAATEQMRLMNSLSSGLLRSNLETAGMARGLREAGLPVQLEQQAVEIYADHDRRGGKIIWYLNDAALEACRRAGEAVASTESLRELPPAQDRAVMVHATLFVIPPR